MPARTSIKIGLAAAAVAGATAAAAAELSSVSLTDGTTVIALNGDIVAGNAEAVEGLMMTTNEGGGLISALRLDSPGGSLEEAVKLAELVRRAKLPTIVSAGSRCVSACFIVFAAGVEKFASHDALIGVHGVSDKFGRETAQTEAATIAMARIVSSYGVPPRIIGQMVITPAQRISWLTADDLRDMGAIMTGRQHADPTATTDPQQLAALDRQLRESVPPTRPAADDRRYAEAYSAAVRGDYARAIRLWQQFADAGDGVSQFNLGQMYAAGQGLPRDLAVAAEWYRRAAESEVPHAQLSLGVAYALGRGVPQDLLQAHKWLDLAARAYTADEDRNRALRARDLVAAKMSVDEIAEARRLAQEWQQQRDASRRRDR